MTAPEVKVSRTNDVLVITIDDQARRNVLSREMRRKLLEESRLAVDGRADHRAVVLTGAGGYFSSGGDLSDMPPVSRAAAADRLAEIRELVELVAMSPLPWIAAVEGPAAGVACGLAAACDHLVAGRSARFLFPFSQLGLVPDGGALLTVAQRIGAHRARNQFLRGDTLSADAGLALGLVDEVVEDGVALERAVAVAGELATRAPGSVAAIKDFYASGPHTLDSALSFEADRQIDQYFSAELVEGKTAFAERRRPHFRSSGGPDPESLSPNTETQEN